MKGKWEIKVNSYKSKFGKDPFSEFGILFTHYSDRGGKFFRVDVGLIWWSIVFEYNFKFNRSHLKLVVNNR